MVFFHETLIYLLIQHIKLFLFYLKRYDGILLYPNFRYIIAALIKGICGYFNFSEQPITHRFPLRDVVEEDEVAEHCDEADQPQAGHHVDHGILQGKFSYGFLSIKF